jgi:hypothetical protein
MVIARRKLPGAGDLLLCELHSFQRVPLLFFQTLPASCGGCRKAGAKAPLAEIGVCGEKYALKQAQRPRKIRLVRNKHNFRSKQASQPASSSVCCGVE